MPSKMSAHFHADIGPFAIDVQLDDNGIRMQSGPRLQTIAWDRISGAMLLRGEKEDLSEQQAEEAKAASFLGAEAAKTIHNLRESVGQIMVAYRDEKNRRQHEEIPAPLNNAEFMQEFQQRLGSRWLGESADREHAAKRLHTNPGCFTTIFVLLALFGIVAAFGIAMLLGVLGPLLNLLSIEKMLLDLQDGNYLSFGYRLLTYAVLFVLGIALHRVIRQWMDARKAKLMASIRAPLLKP
jgi:hypothetical protein